MKQIRKFKETMPQLASSTYVDEAALVIGDVVLAEDVSIWPMTVLRGDVNSIRIGVRTNIQDGSVLHVTHSSKDNPAGFGLTVGESVTVGHKVILHGCSIGDYCLIGMGSQVLDGAILHDNVMLGAGSLVAPGKELEGGFLYVGSPARKIRQLSEKELAWFKYSADHYVSLKNQY